MSFDSEKRREYRRQYYVAHRERILKRASLWNRDNRQRYLENHRKYDKLRDRSKKHMEEQNKQLDVSPTSAIWNVPYQTAPITEEQFQGIKELLFRGEIVGDIIRISKRSYAVVTTIDKAKDYQDYKAIQRAGLQPKKNNPVPVPLREALPRDRYERLEIAKKRFEEVVIGFIAEELREANRELLAKIQELTEENKRLKETSFADTLKQTLVKGGE